MSFYGEQVTLPESFLLRLQPAGAFLTNHHEAQSLQSPTAQGFRASQQAPPMMTPRGHGERIAQIAPALSKETTAGTVAASFLSTIRRGLNDLNDSDDEDDDENDEEEEDDDGAGYYQPAYNQYYAPTGSFMSTATPQSHPVHQLTPEVPMDDDELIFPMEL